MNEAIIAVIHERDQDFILSCLRFRESMPKENRKHLIGPIVSSKGDRCFIFLPSSGKAEEDRQKFLEHLRNKAPYCHVQFGDGITKVFSSDGNNQEGSTFYTEKIKQLEASLIDTEEHLREEIEDLIQDNDSIRHEIYKITIERDEALSFINRDAVLFEAIENLKNLRGKKKALEAASKVVEEFKDKTDIPDSIRALMESMK